MLFTRSLLSVPVRAFVKVIRKTYVLGDDDSSGDGDSGGEETLELPGLVQAGGTVTITNNQAGELNGDLYGSGFLIPAETNLVVDILREHIQIC